MNKSKREPKRTTSSKQSEDPTEAVQRSQSPVAGSSGTSAARSGTKRTTSQADKLGKYTDTGATPIQDAFCWVCHSNLPDVHWMCKTCPRSFHNNCCMRDMKVDGYPLPNVRKISKPGEPCKLEFLECPECIVNKQDFFGIAPKIKTRSEEDVKKILMYLCKRIRTSYKVVSSNPFINILKSQDTEESDEYVKSVAKVMDIEKLEMSIQSGQTKTVEGFYGELKWLVHNSVIFDGVTSAFCRQTKELLVYARQEMILASQCPDCYIRSNEKQSPKDIEWFLKPCNPPHILAWAKISSCPWWPTKIRTISKTKGTVNVMFFGDQSNADVPLGSCFLYSEQIPNGTSGAGTKLRKKALKEIKDHIERLKLEYGTVVLADDCNSPIPQKLDEEDLRVMFPNFGLQAEV